MSAKKYLLGREIVPIPDLEKWATPRLLRFYRATRNFTSRQTDSSPCRYQNELEDLRLYVGKVKELLDKREHVVHKCGK